jgi:hypothetical protein
MHRSGTSIVTRILNLLGASLGNHDRFLQPNEANPDGYWENQLIKSLNEEILIRLGGSWHDLPCFPDGWATSPDLADLRTKATEIVQQEFDGAQLWCWKDPRASITIPFWQEILPNMKYVICLRDPLSVAKSLEKRNGLSIAKASQLWVSYVVSAFIHTNRAARTIICYESLCGNFDRELKNLVKIIGTGEIDPIKREQIQSSIRLELWHYRENMTANLLNSEIVLSAKALYFLLRKHIDKGQLNLELSEQEILRAFWTESDHLRGELRKKTGEIIQLREMLKETKRDRQKLDDQLHRSIKLLQQREQDLTEKTRLLEDSKTTLSKIKSSLFWKIFGKYTDS